MPSTSVRRAAAADAPLLHAVAAATFALACPPGTTEEAVADFIATQLSEARFEEYLADPVRDVLIVEAHSEPVGYAMLVAAPSHDPDVIAAVPAHPAVELSKFYLLAGAHGTGAAAVLMRASIERARGRGAAVLWLGVNQHNARANRFYEKHGFENVGIKHFVVGGKREDDYVRALPLPAH
jgi:ribosomal protein S18 acetylase RimI-like enzyme